MEYSKRCGNCGTRDVAWTNVKGKFFPYMHYDKLELVVNLHLYQCMKCNITILTPGDSKRLDEALEMSLSKNKGHNQ